VAAVGTGAQTSDEVARVQPTAGSSTEKADEAGPNDGDKKPAAKTSQWTVAPKSRWNIAPKEIPHPFTNEPDELPTSYLEEDENEDYDSEDIDPDGPRRMRGPDGAFARDAKGNVIYHERKDKSSKEPG
jgi:hypothetical protein